MAVVPSAKRWFGAALAWGMQVCWISLHHSHCHWRLTSAFDHRGQSLASRCGIITPLFNMGSSQSRHRAGAKDAVRPHANGSICSSRLTKHYVHKCYFERGINSSGVLHLRLVGLFDVPSNLLVGGSAVKNMFKTNARFLRQDANLRSLVQVTHSIMQYQQLHRMGLNNKNLESATE